MNELHNIVLFSSNHLVITKRDVHLMVTIDDYGLFDYIDDEFTEKYNIDILFYDLRNPYILYCKIENESVIVEIIKGIDLPKIEKIYCL